MEIFVYFLLALAAVAAAFYAIWIAVAATARVLAWLLVAWIVMFAGGLVVGVMTGVVIPFRVLRGRAQSVPRIATPEEVVAGRVLGAAPQGKGKHFGWDHAWPVYNPHQAKYDANAVLAEARARSAGAFARRALSSESKPRQVGRLGRMLLALLILPARVSFALGVLASTCAWYLVMMLLGGCVYLVQQAIVLGYRWNDALARRRRRAMLRCVHCYRATPTPSYRCANESCTSIHHDIRPGPLGIVRRRCGCGAALPATIRRAARRLVAACPYCLKNVPAGSGTRRVLLVPVVGAVSAGKTQFLSSGVAALRESAVAANGSLSPISPLAEQFLENAHVAMSSGRAVAKTPWEDRPEGLPFVLAVNRREVEVQLMDAAGENFADWQRSQGLGYIDTADLLLFILDPLSLPRVFEQLPPTLQHGGVKVAKGDPQDAYASVVDRLRAAEVKLGAKRLAVVVTKHDALRSIHDLGSLDPSDGASIKAWLRANGADGLVRRVDQDFKTVEYFVVDSVGTHDGSTAAHPVRVLDWALTTTDRRLSLVRGVAVPAGEGAS